MANVLTTMASDAYTYFVAKNKVANNAVVASTVVAAPDLINVIGNITAGVSLDNAVATGGPTMYLAIGVYVLRFAIYLYDKYKKTA